MLQSHAWNNFFVCKRKSNVENNYFVLNSITWRLLNMLVFDSITSKHLTVRLQTSTRLFKMLTRNYPFVNNTHTHTHRHTHTHTHTHIYIYICIYCPVGWGCRIHRLLLCRGVRHPPTGVLDMTRNNLMVRFHQGWSFGECGVPLYCHWSKVHSGPEWQYLIRVLSMG